VQVHTYESIRYKYKLTCMCSCSIARSQAMSSRWRQGANDWVSRKMKDETPVDNSGTLNEDGRQAAVSSIALNRDAAHSSLVHKTAFLSAASQPKPSKVKPPPCFALYAHIPLCAA
jgi:hypothetical protein